MTNHIPNRRPSHTTQTHHRNSNLFEWLDRRTGKTCVLRTNESTLDTVPNEIASILSRLFGRTCSLWFHHFGFTPASRRMRLRHLGFIGLKQRYYIFYSLKLFFTFYPRDAMLARSLPSKDVCLSVCLSVCHMPVLCLNGNAKHILKLFEPSGNPSFHFFLTPRRYPKYTGVRKIRDFRLKSPSISETVRVRPVVRPTMEH